MEEFIGTPNNNLPPKEVIESNNGYGNTLSQENEDGSKAVLSHELTPHIADEYPNIQEAKEIPVDREEVIL